MNYDFPLASIDLERVATDFPPSASDSSRLLPDDCWSNPLLGMNADSSIVPVQWDKFHGVQDPPAELSRDGTLYPSFWSQIQINPEDRHSGFIGAVEPTSEPRTNEHDDVEMIYPPHTMNSVVSVSSPQR